MQLPSTVHNHFRIVRLFKEQELGQGSFATVCRAQCDDLPCAAKVLHAGFFDQQDPDPGEQTFIARFVEECKILPSITHPNIVQCFGTYQDPDTDLPVLLMELMDESLTNYIERFRGPLPYHIEVSFSYDIALGLSYLHSRGYVHRDLSSNNVLIMAGARAKITDFGMCRAMTGPSYRQTRLTLCPGTHPFMPPEALIDPPIYTDKLDVFSLGAVMIQIMSRQYPNPGPAHRQLRTMLLQAIPEEERRSNHIKLIHQGHQMLPLAKQCIQNSYHERPASHDVCNVLRSLKESHDYQQSKDQEGVEQKLEKAAQLHEAQCQTLQIRHQEEIARIKVEYEAHYQRLQARHQVEIVAITKQHSKDIQEQRANIEAAHAQELQQLRQLQHLKYSTPPLDDVHSQPPALPPRGLAPQRQQSAQLALPAVQGLPLSLQHRQDNQKVPPNGRRSSASDVQSGQSDRQWRQPPPSPLLQQSGPPVQQRNTPIIPPNSRDNYNVDKMIDKSQGIGIDSVKYIPDAATFAASPEAWIPFNPLNLPEPAFDPHDLERFHQQDAYSLEDPYASSNMSLLINPHSDDLGDFSGPNLDDHLAYRSLDSGHMGLSESSAGSALGKSAEEKSESEQQRHKEESEYYDDDDDTFKSGIQFGIVSWQRVEDVKYELVDLQKDSQSSGDLIHSGQDTSIDSQPPTVYSQGTQQTTPPVARVI